jgi:hypothetical protein
VEIQAHADAIDGNIDGEWSLAGVSESATLPKSPNGEGAVRGSTFIRGTSYTRPRASTVASRPSGKHPP